MAIRRWAAYALPPPTQSHGASAIRGEGTSLFMTHVHPIRGIASPRLAQKNLTSTPPPTPDRRFSLISIDITP
jgi:hypothetical protein